MKPDNQPHPAPSDREEPARVNRRDFLSSAMAAGLAATGAGAAGKASARQAADDAQAPGALPPTAAQEAMESEIPHGYSADQAREYFVRNPGSDFMLDVIRRLGLEYIATNPGSSFRGLQESIVNYGGNQAPELLTCVHEEQAAAMAHGYYKVSGKPMGVLCHGTVGLQHASMAVYNAWCDRAPMILLAGNHLEATERRAGVEWSHSAQDCVRVIRDYIKWDDMPLSLQHYAESMARALKIAMTPPAGPVAVVLDGHLQEAEAGNQRLSLFSVSVNQPPTGNEAAVAEAARWLLEAESPVIVADLMARDQVGVERLVALAEALQVPVVNQFGRMNFPNTHHLSQGATAVAQADVVLGLELFDVWGVINTVRDRVHRDSVRKARPDARVISIGCNDLFTKSNYQNFQRFYPSDLSIAGDAQATLPMLTDAVLSGMRPARRATNAAREARWREAHSLARAQALDEARYGWNASPVSTARLYAELWNVVKDRDWALVSDDGAQSRWARRLWPIESHHQYIGRSGGAGLGYGAPAAIGAALAHRAEGRFALNVQKDGDLMYTPGVFWTAAYHRIPLLTVTHNNQGYHQEFMHLQRMAARRQRGIDSTWRVGNELRNPDIDFSRMAGAMGVWGEGPITDPDDLGEALARAAEVVDGGEPAFVDVRCQPR